MRDNAILVVVARFTIPLIMLFALYVQFHGEYSPGGGFQAGVMFGAAWILFVLVYGLETGLRIIPERLIYTLACLGVLLYCFIGLLGVLLGGRYLDFYPLLPGKHAGQQAGIILVEFGVGVTVASVVMLIFLYFSRRRSQVEEAGLDVEWPGEEE
ncbi:Na(+)/H(+) antiporter subunit B [Sediminicurvatus halobius]|uniref:Cation:proton antiporter n=1 Tax=Sediminicurvatus halobius TaxID=2182432 RepID=A0A2U2N7H4_9GAMM|nr:Na(+)/H(+) antiporter subunit B [Spiribacter halobius]PWG65131.1 cation:proton antiporter [Spiribacter halobius]UEX78921.1 Na(+)/H(+) antiporter subunit B [Spiribacter halobius]